MKRDLSRRRSLAPFLLGFTIYVAWPAQALAQALVRVVHAVPGAGTATLQITSGSSTTNAGSVAFGHTTPWSSIRSGTFRWRLAKGGGTLASGSATIGSGSYTAVLLAKGQGVTLGLYRDRAGEPGTSLVRVIHAAPELGAPSLKFDGKVAAPSLAFTAATPYLSVNPGVHSFAAMSAGNSAPVLAGSLKLQSDVSYTAVVVGSRGERVRVVTVTDRGAPLTHPAAAAGAANSQAPSSAPTTSRSGWVIVKPGDSLWSIARAHAGARGDNPAVGRLVLALWNANSGRIGTGDPNLIFPGQRLRLPSSR